MKPASSFQLRMCRRLVTSVVVNGCFLACGHQIDTNVEPTGGAGGDAATTPLADGGVVDSATVEDIGPSGSICGAAYAHDFTGNLAASEDGWSVRPSSMFDGGITAYDVAGGVADHLRFQGAADAPAYLERPLSPGCDRATVRVRFQIIDAPPFDLLSIALGPLSRMVIRYDTARLGVVWVETGSTSQTTVFGKQIQTSTFYVLNVIVNRDGEVWATIDDSIDFDGPPLVAHTLVAGGADPTFVRVGADNVASGPGNSVDLDTIVVAPP